MRCLILQPVERVAEECNGVVREAAAEPDTLDLEPAVGGPKGRCRAHEDGASDASGRVDSSEVGDLAVDLGRVRGQPIHVRIDHRSPVVVELVLSQVLIEFKVVSDGLLGLLRSECVGGGE